MPPRIKLLRMLLLYFNKGHMPRETWLAPWNSLVTTEVNGGMWNLRKSHLKVVVPSCLCSSFRECQSKRRRTSCPLRTSFYRYEIRVLRLTGWIFGSLEIPQLNPASAYFLLQDSRGICWANGIGPIWIIRTSLPRNSWTCADLFGWVRTTWQSSAPAIISKRRLSRGLNGKTR